jgi:N6-L-threonylcarbamoyladenine synthase
MLILGVETTCDETSCAVVRDGRQILSNVVSSQIDLHAQFGGVVPELSCRRHLDVLIPILQQALQEAGCALTDIDLFAVAHGPGLIGPLLIGITAVKTLALVENKPFIAINHIEAHLYAALMSHSEAVEFPCLGVVLSGGHTAIVLMRSIGTYEIVGETVDDAIGEAFDKVGKLLGVPYPGGPEIEKLARMAAPHNQLVPEVRASREKITSNMTAFIDGKLGFKPGKVKGKPLHFSFSGLKTALLYTIKGQDGKAEAALSESDKQQLAYAFQHAAFTDVIQKTVQAAKMYHCSTVIFGGGVTNSQSLRAMFAHHAPELRLLWPSAGLSLDNGAMIAGLAYHQYRQRGAGDSFDLEARTRIAW